MTNDNSTNANTAPAGFSGPGHIRPVWLEIDAGALAQNLGEIRRLTSARAAVCASLKANAYGHGAAAAAAVFAKCGVERFSVALLDEAIGLRKAGVDAPILILGLTERERAAEAVAYGLTQTVASLEDARPLSDEAARRGAEAAVHIKVDTGMGRTGFVCVDGAFTASAADGIMAVAGLPGLRVEGIYTHFATADEADAEYTRIQFAAFVGLTEELRRRGLAVPVRHCANSAAIMGFPDSHFEMVRPGIALYGGAGALPGVHHRAAALRPAMSLRARVSFVKRIGAGMSVGYGRRFIADRESVIATLPLGYGDGYSRALSGGLGEVLIGGRRAPIVGNICMDQLMVDVTDIGGVTPGSEATLLGAQGPEAITAVELADKLDTIPYEVMCAFSARVPRVYTRDGKPIPVPGGKK